MRNEVRITCIVVAVSCLMLTCPMLGMGAWFFYDATVTYPQMHEQWRIYEALWYSGAEDWYEQWEAYARQQGWPITPPQRRIYDEDIVVQYIGAGLCSFVGILSFVLAAALIFVVRRKPTPPQPMA